MNAFDDPFEGKSGIYQFTMSHLPEGRIFRKEEDYIYGVNSLALATTVTPVQLLGYVLMSNHLHLLLKGIYLACCEFYYFIIRRLRRMLSKEYQLSGVLHESAFNVSAVTDRQMFVNELAYILRNAYKARLGSPYSYRWSSADVYFKTHQPNGMHVNSLCLEERRRIFRTKFAIPDSYEYRDGVILNTCFVSSAIVSGLFNGSVEYFDFLRKYSLEAEVEEKHGVHLQLKFSDAEIQERINDICINEFHARSVRHLDRKCLLRVARIAAARFGAGRAQLSRLLGIDKDILDRIL